MAYLFPTVMEVARVTQLFGPRTHPVTGKPQNHGGMDIGVASGTPVYAMDDGVVIAAKWDNNGGGYYVKVEHADSKVSAYLHLTTFIVQTGQRVRRGELIAYSGSTGTSTAPHLHVEVRAPDGTKLDPLDFWSGKIPAKRENLGVDYVYGRADRWLKVALLLAAGAGGYYWWTRRRRR